MEPEGWRLLAFLDESGDAGMKLDKGSSPLFVVAFDDHAEAIRCDAAISVLRSRLALPKQFEFHFAENSVRQQQAFLETIAPFEFQSHIFALNKVRASGPGFGHKDSLHKWSARTMFEKASPYLNDATVVIDGSGERAFRREFSSYLRKQVNQPASPNRIKSIKIQASHHNNLLPLADYVVGDDRQNAHCQARWSPIA